MKFLGLLLCRLGFHKARLVHPKTGEDIHWATVGFDYKQKCRRCNAETETFTLTRGMLP